MQDEQFMRQWTAGHDRFSTDLGRGLGGLLRHFSRRDLGRKPIGSSYAFLARYEEPRPARPALPPAAQASLRGLAASVITFALWFAVMLIATPTPGLASPLDAPTAQASECLVRPVLA